MPTAKPLPVPKRSSLEQKVVTLLSDLLGVEEDEITPQASLVKDLGADSLDQVEMVMALEENFSLEIADEDGERLDSLAEILTFLGRRGVKK